MLIYHTEHNPISVFAGKAGLKMKNPGMKKKWSKLLQACLLLCLASASLLLLGSCGSQTASFQSGITAIPDGAFKGNSSILTAEIPDTVTSIGDEAFRDCEVLQTVTIPPSVTHIGAKAFEGCRNLKEIIIPDSVKTIGDGAFDGCKSLGSVTLPKGMTAIGDRTFSSCSLLSSVTIPDSVTRIGVNAFSGCKALESLRIPDSVSEIGNGAFSDCKALREILLPGSLTTIPDYVFSGCEALAAVVIPGQVTAIGQNAFYNCHGLAAIALPEGVKSVGECAFFNCTSLKDVTQPDSVEEIGSHAFLCCESLEKIRISGRTRLADGVFAKCPETAEVTTAAFVFAEPAFRFRDGISAVSGESLTLSLGGFLQDERRDPKESIVSLTIPDSVIAIGSDALAGYRKLEKVVIPDSVTSIGDRAFKGCASLKSLHIPDTVTEIGSEAFSDCTSLESVNIPASLKRIGPFALWGCTGITEIRNTGNTGFAIGSHAFDGTVLMKNARAMIPDTFDGAADFSEAGMEAGNLRYLPLDGQGLWSEFYNLLPEEHRTYDPDAADCILFRRTEKEKSTGNYVEINPNNLMATENTMYDTITRIYLVFRDGRAYDAGAVRKEPPRTGETVFTKGQIYREVTPAAYASAEEVMEKFGGVLLPAGQAESNQDGK